MVKPIPEMTLLEIETALSDLEDTFAELLKDECDHRTLGGVFKQMQSLKQELSKRQEI